MNQQQLSERIKAEFGDQVSLVAALDCVTVTLAADHLLSFCQRMHDDDAYAFDTLLDVCGVDYADYGRSYWRQGEQTTGGYSRAVSTEGDAVLEWDKPRYAVVYHLLSVEHNHRLRIKVYLEPEPSINSVIDIWPSANWYEREAFDLFGIFFVGHPDLRRILTDYGFKGHPLRKDFPLIGEVEMRYDAKRETCVYEPVSIQPRVLVPKVIRQDSRYVEAVEGES